MNIHTTSGKVFELNKVYILDTLFIQISLFIGFYSGFSLISKIFCFLLIFSKNLSVQAILYCLSLQYPFFLVRFNLKFVSISLVSVKNIT